MNFRRVAKALPFAATALMVGMVSYTSETKEDLYNQQAKVKINGTGKTGMEGYAQGFVDAEFLDPDNVPYGNPTFYAHLSKPKLNKGENYIICFESHSVWNKSIVRSIAGTELVSRIVIVDKAIPARNNINLPLDCAR